LVVEARKAMHLSAEVALDLIETRAGRDETEFWSHHVAECEGCRERLQDWSHLHLSLEGKRLETAPAKLIHKAERIFEHSHEPQTAGVTEVLASLLFDSFAQPAFAGARGSAAGARQIVFRTEQFDVHLKVSDENRHRRIVGQVLARKGAGLVETCRLFLLKDGECRETTLANDLGEFEFSEVPEGPVSLRVGLPGMNLVGAVSL
jgi:hypothetical protein